MQLSWNEFAELFHKFRDLPVYGQERKLAWNIFQMIFESGRVVKKEIIFWPPNFVM